VHQALLDPKGQYLLFPDLGADLVHVYAIEPQTNKLVAHSPLRSKKGYGPRHAVFWSPDDEPDSTFLFVIHELANKIVSYAVEYLPAGGLAFQEVDEVSTFGDRQIPKTAAASEIVKVHYISLPCTLYAANTLQTPDNKFIIAGNRLGPIFKLANPDPNNSTMIQSDSLITLKPDSCGMLEFMSLIPSGGLNPRHFSLNKDGSKIAIANGDSRNVIVLSRDCETGEMKNQIAAASHLGPGALT
jgi:6-phosphogluconolactonase (cycloisomerase 2 family)